MMRELTSQDWEFRGLNPVDFATVSGPNTAAEYAAAYKEVAPGLGLTARRFCFERSLRGATDRSTAQEIGVSRARVGQLRFEVVRVLDWHIKKGRLNQIPIDKKETYRLESDVGLIPQRILSTLLNNGIETLGDLAKLTHFEVHQLFIGAAFECRATSYCSELLHLHGLQNKV